MIVTVFVRRLKKGRTFAEFVAEWQADVGFGVPTRVFNALSLDDPHDVISIGFVAVTPDGLREWLARGSASEQSRHERIDTVIESTTLRCMYEVRSEHDFTGAPLPIEVGSADSLLHALATREFPDQGQRPWMRSRRSGGSTGATPSGSGC